MTTKIADDFEYIRRRQEELAAERNLALTGSTLEEPKVGEYAKGWPMYGYTADYDPSAYVFTIPDLRGRVKPIES